MSNLTGTFSKIASQKVEGMRIISFSLKCTNWLQSETIDFMLSDAQNNQPWYYRQQTIKAGGVFTFNFDTCGWQWYQGDFFAILDKKGKIEQSWQLRLKEYAPGECPECHGTHKCGHCRGQGVWADLKYGTGIQTCPYCGGTGVCDTCNIPRRSFQAAPQNFSFDTGSSRGTIGNRHRPIALIQQDIRNLESKIEREEWNFRQNQLNGLYADHFMLFSADNELLYTLRCQLLELQEELRDAMS